MVQQDHGPAGAGGSGQTSLPNQGQIRREAGSVGAEARGAVRDVMDEAKAAGERVKSEAAGLAGTVKQQLASQAEAQKDSVAERIAAVARQVHGAADGLRDQERWLAELMDRGARELDGFAEELRQRDVRSLVGSVESLAHRHPALFMGTAVALGFALTRMVRGGYEGSGGQRGRSYGGYAGPDPSYPSVSRSDYGYQGDVTARRTDDLASRPITDPGSFTQGSNI